MALRRIERLSTEQHTESAMSIQLWGAQPTIRGGNSNHSWSFYAIGITSSRKQTVEYTAAALEHVDVGWLL